MCVCVCADIKNYLFWEVFYPLNALFFHICTITSRRIYLYFPMYIYIYMYVCIFCQNFFINTNFVEYNRHVLSTYFLVDPFTLPY